MSSLVENEEKIMMTEKLMTFLVKKEWKKNEAGIANKEKKKREFRTSTVRLIGLLLLLFRWR